MEVQETLQSCWLQQPPLDTTEYPGVHPAGLWAQEWLLLLKTKKQTNKQKYQKKKIQPIVFAKNFFSYPLVDTGVIII